MPFLSRLIATGLFSGYFPAAPGTAGSALGVVLYWVLPNHNLPLLLSIIAIGFLSGVWAATQVENQTGIEDNGIIVIDEIIGVWITLLGAGAGLKWLAIGFIIFRLFDIVKPFPVRKLEALPGGWGVMLDDVGAGIYGAAACFILGLFL
jgi:phosphatidylglycerophosphatase A